MRKGVVLNPIFVIFIGIVVLLALVIFVRNQGDLNNNLMSVIIGITKLGG